jgi:acyl-CoA synthetase (NDP forming)
VHLNLPDGAAVHSAYEAAALGRDRPLVAVQPMAAAGVVELVAGVVHDPLFGSLVMLGLGAA